METSLHRQLKQHYAGTLAPCEVRLGSYRVDVVRDDELIEIQHGSLAAIRDKVRRLLESHRVRVVKPIVLRKRLLRLSAPDGPVVAERLSPKQGRLLDLFDELVHFTRVFPHPRLTLEVPLIEVEERRYPGHGRRRRWRRNDFQVLDQVLLEIREIHQFQAAADLLGLLRGPLPQPFHTGDLARTMGIHRSTAQRIAYCLRHAGAGETVGKLRNALLYHFPEPAIAKPSARRRRRSA